MKNDPEKGELGLGGTPELVGDEADELMQEAGAVGDPDAIEELALDLLDSLSDYDQGAEFGLMLVDELRRRAVALRERPQ